MTEWAFDRGTGNRGWHLTGGSNDRTPMDWQRSTSCWIDGTSCLDFRCLFCLVARFDSCFGSCLFVVLGSVTDPPRQIPLRCYTNNNAHQHTTIARRNRLLMTFNDLCGGPSQHFLTTSISEIIPARMQLSANRNSYVDCCNVLRW